MSGTSWWNAILQPSCTSCRCCSVRTLPAAQVQIVAGGTDIPIELLAATGLEFTVDDHSPRTALVIPNDLLDQPMPCRRSRYGGDERAQCQELLDRRSHRGGLRGPTRTRLLEDPARDPSMAAVARELAVTERTLHRRLAAENTSFRTLVEEIRRNPRGRAARDRHHGRGGRAPPGLLETAAFTRAFIRWRGHHRVGSIADSVSVLSTN